MKILWLVVLFLALHAYAEIRLHKAVIDTDTHPAFNPSTYQDVKAGLSASLHSSLARHNHERAEHSISSDAAVERMMQRSQIETHPLCLVELESISRKSEAEKRLGVPLGRRYVADNAYVVRVPLDMIPTDLPSHGIKWIGYMHPEYKSLLGITNVQSTKIVPLKPIEFYVLLNHNIGDYSAEEDVHIWDEYLRAVLPSTRTAQVIAVSKKKLKLRVSPEVAGDVLAFIKSHEAVEWVELKYEMRLMNKYGAQLVQSGARGNGGSGANSSYPIWERGIRGQGQIVGIGDTGIDWDNCFFSDPEYSGGVPIDKVDDSHRKIVTYITSNAGLTTDSQDTLNGHGTHTSGSIAGNALDNEDVAQYNGMAPEAKLAFYDIEGDPSQGLVIPDDLSENYFPPRYDAGARIDSNSWGCSYYFLWYCYYDCECYWNTDQYGGVIGELVDDAFCQEQFGARCCQVCNFYTTLSLELDQFSSDNPDFLILFSAGNDGETSSSNSVASPSTAKNNIAVGASNTAEENFADDWLFIDYETNLATIQGLKDLGITTIEECCAYSNPEDEALEDIVKSLCCPDYVRDEEYADETIYNPLNVAYFSSRGPTFDGRIKPEIVAPGYVTHSARSDGDTGTGQCALVPPEGPNEATVLSMAGTSMACPTAAGAAALARQYFVDGWYPSGSARSRDELEPSGALLKAVLIHSAEGLDRTVRGDGEPIQDLGDIPNIYEGYGLINLGNVLRFSDSDFDLWVIDDSVEDGETKSYSFTTTEAVPFKVTLSWFDPPPSPSSTSLQVNILSLNVNVDDTDNPSPTSDLENTKMVVVDISDSDSSVRVEVTGSSVPSGPQAFGLVVTGRFSEES